MPQKKKLQVFISSTYSDMKDERQAAVEAILTAGHIPAGMELFSAGDESQMNVIKRWIDESDVYMLILGGRYGSIEPKSQKSYIQLEYEYALEKDKPLFAVVIGDNCLKKKIKKLGADVIETEHPEKFKEFKSFVLTKMVRFWDDPKDIKLAILETMAEISYRSDLVGWISGNESVNSGPLAEELARLAKENAILRERIANSPVQQSYSGISFDEMVKLLTSSKIELSLKVFKGQTIQEFREIAKCFGDEEPKLIHYFWFYSRTLQTGMLLDNRAGYNLRLMELGLLKEQSKLFSISEIGRQFLLRLRLERDLANAEKHIEELTY